jgi:hypothetical protein
MSEKKEKRGVVTLFESVSVHNGRIGNILRKKTVKAECEKADESRLCLCRVTFEDHDPYASRSDGKRLMWKLRLPAGCGTDYPRWTDIHDTLSATDKEYRKVVGDI